MTVKYCPVSSYKNGCSSSNGLVPGWKYSVKGSFVIEVINGFSFDGLLVTLLIWLFNFILTVTAATSGSALKLVETGS